MYGKHHSDEAKAKIAKAASNRSQETHEKMSASAKSRVARDGAPFQGKHLSESAKEKLRQVDKSYMKTQLYHDAMSAATSGAKNGQAIKIKATSEDGLHTLSFGCKKEVMEFLHLSRAS